MKQNVIGSACIVAYFFLLGHFIPASCVCPTHPPLIEHKFLTSLNVSFTALGTSTPPPENIVQTATEESSASTKQADKVVKVDPLLESSLLECLCGPSVTVPVDSFQLASTLSAKVH